MNMAGGKEIEGWGTDNREREPVTKNEDSDDRITRKSEAKTLYTCLTSIPRFALREKVTLRLLKLLL